MSLKILHKYIFLLVIFLISSEIFAQRIGGKAGPKPPEIFPNNAIGADILFSESGFGLGTFFRKSFSRNVTGFIDLSISESKDDREIEFIDYFGQKQVFGKINRVFMAPLNIGIQYRLFSENLTDNLRPYVTAGVGPNFMLTTPYEMEFFNAFAKAQFKLAAGGYVGFGANFGLSKKNLMGISVRYYFVHLFDDGVENLENRFRKDFQHIMIALNLGLMY